MDAIRVERRRYVELVLEHGLIPHQGATVVEDVPYDGCLYGPSHFYSQPQHRDLGGKPQGVQPMGR